MGNHLKNFMGQKFMITDHISLPNFIIFPFILVGASQSITYCINYLIKSYSSRSHLHLKLEGKKTKWAFILNATSNLGYAISEYLAKNNYNLILGSFESEKLDNIKANLYMDYQNVMIEPYYFYKSDMKNFEEKFHFRDFLKNHHIEVFIFNDCLIKNEGENFFLSNNYEELQYELSKKFLLKTFLFKIVVENAKKFDKNLNHIQHIFNVNEINDKNQEILNFQGYEDFLKEFIDEKYSELNLRIYNIYNRNEEKENVNYEVYKASIIKKIFGN